MQLIDGHNFSMLAQAKVLGVSTRRRVFDSAKKLNVVLRKLRGECPLPAPQAALTAAQHASSSRLDALLAAAEQFLDLSVATYGETPYGVSPSEDCVALLSDALDDVIGDSDLDDKDGVHEQVM